MTRKEPEPLPDYPRPPPPPPPPRRVKPRGPWKLTSAEIARIERACVPEPIKGNRWEWKAQQVADLVELADQIRRGMLELRMLRKAKVKV